jgi:hypothetical protein
VLARNNVFVCFLPLFSLKLFQHILSEDKQRALSKPHHISRM